VRRAAVNGMADLDLAQWFDPRPPMDILAVVAERLTDRRCRRRIARRRKAGVQTPGGGVADALGSPQGAMGSPVIATGCVDTVLDPWGAPTVKAHGRGSVERRRAADETRRVGARADEAPRVRRVLPGRLATFGGRLNAQHTRRVACAPGGTPSAHVGRPRRHP
jgi:RNA-directed DNA polymerase